MPQITPPFEIGLTMTGSVSAGAYTAGVVDFLLEALENWEKLKQQNQTNFGNDYTQWTTPWHNVVLKGVSGASGGGVTSGLILNTIGGNITPVPAPVEGNVTGNDFYNAWVNGIGIEGLTGTDDLADDSCKSLLDGNAIPNTAGKILQPDNFGNTVKKNYIADNLRAIITITNLRGIPYFLKTSGIGANQLVFYRNADYVKLELDRNNQKVTTPDAVSIPYNMTDVRFNEGYAKLKAACLATCAFPGAFPAQPVTQDGVMYTFRPNADRLALDTTQPYTFLNSDGGICNNSPFELLRADMQLGPAVQDAKSVTQSIIIVAPLDTDMAAEDNGTYNTKDLKKDDLITILSKVVGAIRNEAEFTDEQIGMALDESIYSRYIIAPVRYDASGLIPQNPPITGQTLQNFGAFLSQDFRVHDFFLGRLNAQLFLKKHFALPVADAMQNPVFQILDLANNKAKFGNNVFVDPADNTEYVCIIPLEGDSAADLYNPKWPTGKYDIEKIQQEINTRVGAFLSNTIDNLVSNFLEREALKGVKDIVEPLLIKHLMNAITTELTNDKL